MQSKHLNDFWPCPEVETIFSNCYCFGAFATAGFTTAAIAANIAVVGTVVSTIGVISAGQSAAGNARFQGQVAGQNAELARRDQVRSEQQAKIDEDDFRRQASRELAARFASGGATGVLLNEGSFSSIQNQIAGEDELNALRLRNQFAVRTSGFGLEAQNQTAQAGLFGAQAKQAGQSAAFSAGSQLFSGASSIAGGFKGTNQFAKAPKPAGGARKTFSFGK